MPTVIDLLCLQRRTSRRFGKPKNHLSVLWRLLYYLCRCCSRGTFCDPGPYTIQHKTFLYRTYMRSYRYLFRRRNQCKHKSYWCTWRERRCHVERPMAQSQCIVWNYIGLNKKSSITCFPKKIGFVGLLALELCMNFFHSVDAPKA